MQRAARLPAGLLAAALGFSGLMAGPAAAQPPDWSLQARQRLQGPGADADRHGLQQQRQQWLDDGERQLALGDAVAAQASFDRAAGMLHAPDTEAALVRTHMQAGDYRRALAFGAHAAGAHRRDWPAGTALYAWLLQAGGQAGAARHYLAEALALAPDDPALRAAQAALASPWPHPGPALQQAPLRLAPLAWGRALPGPTRVVGSAVLLGTDQALAASALLGPAAGQGGQVWLRNGLGQTVAATLQAQDGPLGLALLRLETALPAATIAAATREPFAGSPAYLVEYATDSSGAPAWPLLQQGFFARQGQGPALRPLGIDAPPGPRGGPVFNAAGDWVGLAVNSGDGQDRLLPVADLQQRFGPWPVPPAPAQAAPPIDIDLIYERALRSSLQLLVAVPP